MKRREFMTWVGIGGLASYLPVALAACSPQKTQSQSTANSVDSEGYQSIGTLEQLTEKGELLSKELAMGSVLVIQKPDNPQEIIAVNPTCPHAGCSVNWKADQKAFLCPCHDSKFAADGQLLEGPAEEPLKRYQAKLEGQTILVKAE
ncbi:ubiquinol-cytochrome c reductase iron-sulfur subunit [Capilliphycus salinus ALCB114379]|uniref:QcrA and Rieske domain-containing protein n=1 Tax=Capilliphycus salinus TaxID=2768948 RepID=UPI0039A6AE7F